MFLIVASPQISLRSFLGGREKTSLLRVSNRAGVACLRCSIVIKLEMHSTGIIRHYLSRVAPRWAKRSQIQDRSLAYSSIFLVHCAFTNHHVLNTSLGVEFEVQNCPPFTRPLLYCVEHFIPVLFYGKNHCTVVCSKHIVFSVRRQLGELGFQTGKRWRQR